MKRRIGLLLLSLSLNASAAWEDPNTNSNYGVFGLQVNTNGDVVAPTNVPLRVKAVDLKGGPLLRATYVGPNASAVSVDHFTNGIYFDASVTLVRVPSNAEFMVHHDSYSGSGNSELSLSDAFHLTAPDGSVIESGGVTLNLVDDGVEIFATGGGVYALLGGNFTIENIFGQTVLNVQTNGPVQAKYGFQYTGTNPVADVAGNLGLNEAAAWVIENSWTGGLMRLISTNGTSLRWQ